MRSERMQKKVGYRIVGSTTMFCPALNRKVVVIETSLKKSDFYQTLKSTGLQSVYDRVLLPDQRTDAD